jgi:BlaI family transcriptional regulator, penicillinase repressor
MARTPRDITDAELAVLQALWERGPSTIRQLTDRLYPEGRAAQYATVQKLLERLEGKKYVRRDRRPAVHVFAAAVGRDELIGRRLQSVAEKLCGGSWTPLLTHLVQSEKLSAADRQGLRDLIDELDQQGRKKKGDKDERR